jgi:hypothetical protein
MEVGYCPVEPNRIFEAPESSIHLATTAKVLLTCFDLYSFHNLYSFHLGKLDGSETSTHNTQHLVVNLLGML